MREAVEEAVTRYLQRLVMEAEDGETVTVRLSAVGGILSDLTRQLVDYSDLTMNGRAENIALRNTEVPVLGEVIVDVVHEPAIREPIQRALRVYAFVLP